MQGSILSVSCRALLAACDGLGLDGDALVRQAGLDRAVIDDPDGRLEPLDVMALWDRAETASGDPHLALRVASRSADPSLLSLLEQHARALLESVAEERTVARDVKRLLRDAGPALGLPEAAKRLGVSERTLQRRLADETCVYADLVSSVREEMARQLMLDRKVAIAEAAFILGFSDQSSFTRSFKRWTGQTPAAFRAEHRTGTAAQIS